MRKNKWLIVALFDGTYYLLQKKGGRRAKIAINSHPI